MKDITINQFKIKPNTTRQIQNSQDEDETDEAGGSAEAVHSALLPRLPLHLHDVRPHAQACHAKVGVSALCTGSLFFFKLFAFPFSTTFQHHILN